MTATPRWCTPVHLAEDDGLAGQIVPLETPGAELKVPFRNGYEHFKATSHRVDPPEGSLPACAGTLPAAQRTSSAPV